MKREIAIKEIIKELLRAEDKFDWWPTDMIHAAAIMNEEAGEAIKAAIDFEYGWDNIEKLKKETIQTGAMALRILVNLPNEKSIKRRKEAKELLIQKYKRDIKILEAKKKEVK